MKSKNKIYVAGHGGMVGSAIVRKLNQSDTFDLITRTHSELDLTDQRQVADFFSKERPDQVYMAAAKVGGIYSNNAFPAEFIYQNLMVQSNVIHQAWIAGVKKILFLGSSCIYPKLASQPMSEDALLTGSLEPTNEPYAIAKIAGIKMCESYNRQYGKSHGIDYRSVMPTNLYGPGDNYHPKNSHVIPGLIRRFHEAKISGASTVVVWGSGSPKREFLYVDDLAEACIHLMGLEKKIFELKLPAGVSHVNVGFGTDVSIYETALAVAEIVGYHGELVFDKSKPDGTPRKLMNSSLVSSLGWSPRVDLKNGLKIAYKSFMELQQ
jgi:GDP-L-fucose synthase